jgi:hypothetical protein
LGQIRSAFRVSSEGKFLRDSFLVGHPCLRLIWIGSDILQHCGVQPCHSGCKCTSTASSSLEPVFRRGRTQAATSAWGLGVSGSTLPLLRWMGFLPSPRDGILFSLEARSLATFDVVAPFESRCEEPPAWLYKGGGLMFSSRSNAGTNGKWIRVS